MNNEKAPSTTLLETRLQEVFDTIDYGMALLEDSQFLVQMLHAYRDKIEKLESMLEEKDDKLDLVVRKQNEAAELSSKLERQMATLLDIIKSK